MNPGSETSTYSLESKTPSDLEVKFRLKCDQPRGEKVADHPLKEPQIQSAPEGGRKAMTMRIMTMTMIMMMILIMTMVIVMCFLHPK